MIPDDRLRLVFTCCHPALAREAQVALTLRLVCGLTHGRDRPGVPGAASRPWPPGSPGPRRRSPRPGSRTGCRRRPSCPSGSTPCSPSCTCCSPPGTPRRPAAAWSATTWSTGRSTWPACSALLMPDEPEVRGLLALLLLTDARRATRVRAGRPAAAARGAGPHPVGPGRHRRGHRARPRGAARRPPGPVRAAGRDRRAARRGTELRRHRLAADRCCCTTCSAGPGRRRSWRSTGPSRSPWPTGRRPAWPRSANSERDGRLAGYRYLPAAKADLLRRLGRLGEAAQAYRAALELTANDAERSFLSRRLAEVTATQRGG